MKKSPLILGIETSCDETGFALYSRDRGMISHALYTQIALHAQFGGVVPELASRSQLEKVGPVFETVLGQAGVTLDDIDVVAVTNRPGLPGSLLVGICFAKMLAYGAQKKLIGVNHLEGHVFSALIEHDVPFNHLCLTASGGHTSLYLVKGFGDFTSIASTKDDAAGEAFDKIAKLMNLPYPGGPVIEQLAAQVGFVDYFNYPRATAKTLDFSFSGLKTAVLYDLVKRDAYDLRAKRFLKDDDLTFKQQVASSLLVCMADIFEQKLQLALQHYSHVKAMTFVGGIACNQYIKDRLSAFGTKKGIQLFVPSRKYCTDNGAMIAFVGAYKAEQGLFDGWDLDIS